MDYNLAYGITLRKGNRNTTTLQFFPERDLNFKSRKKRASDHHRDGTLQ
jgi:hypothetical protein